MLAGTDDLVTHDRVDGVIPLAATEWHRRFTASMLTDTTFSSTCAAEAAHENEPRLAVL